MTRTLYRGGRVYSRLDPFATALLIDGGVIAWIGTDSAADASAADVVVDLGDRFVTPAFVDAHVHATSTGLALDGLDLAGAASLGDALDRVSLHCRSRPTAAIVLGTGWDESAWPERRAPTAAELDRAADGRAVYLSRVDVHSAVVSTSLLHAVDRATPGWDRLGWLRTDAHHLVRRVALSSVDASQREAAQRRMRSHAASLGIGCLHEMAGPDISGEDDLVALLALADAEPGPEVIGYWAAAGDVDTPRRLGLRGGAGDLFVDGAVGSRTAALHAPYADAADTSGHLWLDTDAVAAHVVACVEATLQPGFHVIGDRAVDTVLDGLERAATAVGRDRLRACRPRLEHAELLAPGAVTRIADLGVFASVQPVFDALWGGGSGMYVDRLGAARAASMNPFAELAAHGVPLAMGSDAPVTSLGPWAAVRAAVHHRTAAHRLSARAAFAAHTRGGWRAAGVDDVGELAPGAPASFAVWETGELVVQVPDERVTAWSTDPRAATPGLPDLDPGAPEPVCVRTVVRGTSAYDAGALA